MTELAKPQLETGYKCMKSVVTEQDEMMGIFKNCFYL